MGYSTEEIQGNVDIALDIFFENDHLLLAVGANERSVSHKIAEYLQLQFQDWNVDCEYNRKEDQIKKLEGIRGCLEQRSSDRIYPDIIIHRRNTDENLLVIEIKTNSPEEDCDIRKLELLTKPDNGYEYSLGLYIRFNGLNRPNKIWFKDGYVFQ